MERTVPARRAELDGLRALAVALVVAYHLDVPGFGGGFVGVDVFFALSGYLITTLLLHESDRTGTVGLRAFWGRRARRLWPLAWLTLAGVGVASVLGVWSAERRADLPGETVAALGHVANWWQVAHGGYLSSAGGPSPLRHFWSLAVEEQFYVVWPLVVVGALAVARRRAGDRVGDRGRVERVVLWALLGGLTAASVVAGFAVAPSTAYLSTAVRAVALLAGAALAVAWRRWPMEGPSGRRARRRANAAGALGAGALLAITLSAHPEDRWLSRGGFTLVAIAATGVVAAAVAGGGRPDRGLATPVLVWVGVRSYAVYLIHWPVAVALGPDVGAPVRTAVVVTVALVGAAVLHVAVERPVAAGRVRARVGAPALAATAAAALALALVAAPAGPTPTELVARTLGTVPDPVAAAGTGTATTDGSGAAPPADRTPATSTAGAAQAVPSSDRPAPGSAAPTVPVPPSEPPCAGAAGRPSFGGTAAFDPATVAEVPDPVAGCRAVRVLTVGDSTGRGASNGLAALGDPRLQVWDRTVLGCSFGDESCPSWRSRWAAAVRDVAPDVVLVYGGVVADLQGAADPEFLSPAGRGLRVRTFVEATRLLSAGGARVLFVAPALPRRPEGLFYCRGRTTGSGCDPRWIAEWTASVREAAAQTGAGVLAVDEWVAAHRGADRAARPDGLHLSGQALLEHARWLVPQLLTAGARRP